MADPLILTVRQGKTYRVVFRVKDTNNNPVSLTGYGARFQVVSRVGGSVLVSVDDTMDDPGNMSDSSVQVEPGATPAIGEIHVRLGADQTASLLRSGAYDAEIYSKTDPTEVQPVCSGPLILLPLGSE